MVNLYINGQLIDQYDDENVEVNSSVLDVYDITKNTGDYSKTFSVPASRRNNKVFKHWYNPSVYKAYNSNDRTEGFAFDARTRIDGSIDIDGVPFRTGKWLLHDVKMSKGVASSYSINFFGDSASLAEITGDDKLKDLDFSALDHVYNSDSVKLGLTNGLSNNSIIYPLMAQKNYFYDNGGAVGDLPNNATGDDITSFNIAYNGNTGPDEGSGIDWTSLRPSIRLLDVIEAIETKYNGVYQETEIAVLTVGTSSDYIRITLNGVQHLILLTAGVSNTACASSIATAVDLIDGYSATSSGVYCTIVSDTFGIEINTKIEALDFFNFHTSIRTTRGSEDRDLGFTRDFFGTTEFERIYMWLNPEVAPKALGNSSSIVDFTSKNATNLYTDLVTNITVLRNIQEEFDRYWNLSIDVNPVNPNITYRVRAVNADLDIGDPDRILFESATEFSGFQNVTANIQMNPFISIAGSQGGTILYDYNSVNVQIEVTSEESFFYTSTMTFYYQTGILQGRVPVPYATASSASAEVTAGVIISDMMPDLKVEEFLKSLIQMFKLVMIGDVGNKFYVNTLDSFYAVGDRFDISRYIDRSKFDISRGEIVSELKFNFKEPTTKGAMKFLGLNGIAYGDSEVRLKSPNGKYVDGDTVDVQLPFENVVFNRLTDYSTGADTRIQIGTILDLDDNPVKTNPMLHYAMKVDVSSPTSKLKFANDADGKVTLDNNVWMPFSHYGVDDPTYSLLFESETSTYTGVRIQNTLYSRHYKDYIEAIYNINRRVIKHTAKLPIQMLTRLSLNDVITIDGLDYRINKYSYNLLTGLTKFELINGFLKYNVTDLFLPESCTVGAEAEVLYFNVPNVSSYSVSAVTGYGEAAWLTTGIEGNEDNLLKIDVSAYAFVDYEDYRYTVITLTSGATGASTDIKIAQKPQTTF